MNHSRVRIDLPDAALEEAGSRVGWNPGKVQRHDKRDRHRQDANPEHLAASEPYYAEQRSRRCE
jgi:hypothetical protein